MGIALFASLLAMPASAFAWKEFAVASPAAGTEYVELRSISCFNLESLTKELCYAVGHYEETTGGASKTLVEKYTSATNEWQVETSPNPAGATSSALFNVACPTETECVAVGGYVNALGEGIPLGERLHSGSWALDNPTPPTSALAQLTGVSCPKSGECLAVGDHHASAVDVSLAYRSSSR